MKRNVNIMKEYNYDIEEIKEENNGYTGFSADGNVVPPKKQKKHTGLKITASLMAMALVSAGSIGIYSRISPRTAAVQTAAVETGDETSESNINVDNVSLIKTEKSDSGEALTTEEIVDKVLPSVVGVESKFTVTSQNTGGFFFGFGGDREPVTSEATGTGTGVVITDSGYIVTNAHVIYDSEYGGQLADSVSVLLDDKTYDAEVVGYEVDFDLAVLKIDAKGLTAAEFGDSDSLRLGETVTAIGNPLGFDLMNTVTGGMISGLNRNISINDTDMTLIQTDAAINSGNSGGPLINKYGQVIGINSSKMSSTYYGEASIEGIGFAIPSNVVSRIVDQLMKYGYVTDKPQLGISCQDVTETIANMYNLPVGVYVTAVTENGAAEAAGLQAGDIITGIDDKDITTSEELNAEKNKHTAGDKVELKYVRNGEEHTAKVTLDKVDAPEE